MAMDNPDSKLVLYFEEMKKKAENLVFNQFPERIHILNELLTKPEFCMTLNDIHNISEEDKTKINENNEKISKIDSSSLMSSNKTICESIRIVKPHLKLLIEDIFTLKMWITILIPKIEDGNNFGVQVQEQALEDIYAMEKSLNLHNLAFLQYFQIRAKLLTKVYKYPFIEDYRESVKECDDHHRILICQALKEVRDNYITLHDILSKNLDKIKKPRSSHGEELY